MITHMADVFVSHTPNDREVASRLRDQLERGGVSVFWAEDIHGGEDWRQTVSNALVQAKAFVLLYPGEADSSPFLQRETEAAIFRNTTGGLLFLPVILSGREPGDDISGFRYIRVESEHDFSAVVRVVTAALQTAERDAPTAAGLRLSFLSSLLRADLDRSPQATSIVLDEISQTVGSDPEELHRQVELLHEAIEWGQAHLSQDHPSVTSLKYRLASALMQFGLYDQSIHLSLEALAATTSSKDKIEASLNLGNAFVATGRLTEAKIYYEKALKLAQGTGSEPTAGTALVALGTVSQLEGDILHARLRYEEAVRVTARLNQPTVRANALISLCEVLGETEAERRRSYAEEALWLVRSSLAGDQELTRRAEALVGLEGTTK